MSMKAGDQLCDGRFGLIKRVGKSASTNVWLALNNEDQEKVLVCALHKHVASDPARQRQVFEASRKMAKLEHPGILWILEPRLEDAGVRFFVKEFVEGESMHDAVLGGRLDQRATLAVISRVGNALGYAHARGMVHRDVNPTNILIDPAGAPRLTDLSLSSSRGRTASAAEIATDVYTLAMTALFGLHGDDLPMLEVMRDAASFIDRLDCDASIKAVLKRATQFDKSKRYPDAASFCAELDAAAAGHAAAVTPPRRAAPRIAPPPVGPRVGARPSAPPPRPPGATKQEQSDRAIATDAQEPPIATPAPPVVTPSTPAPAVAPIAPATPITTRPQGDADVASTLAAPLVHQGDAREDVASVDVASVDVASVDASVDVASVDVASEDIASEDIASDEDHDAAPTTEHAVDAPISSPGLFPPIDADAPPRARADATPPELFADVTSAPEPRRGATPIVLGLVALLVIGFGLWFALTRGGDERDPTIAAIERHEGAREADGAAESADAAERPGSSSSDDPDDAAEPLKPAASDVDAPDEVEPDEVEPDEVEPDEVEPDEVEPDDDTPDEPTATSTKSTSEKPKPARKKTLAATWKYLEKRVRTQCTKLVSGPTKVSVELTLRGPEGRVKAVALGSHAMTSLGKCVASSISRSNVKPFDPGPEPVIKRDLAFD